MEIEAPPPSSVEEALHELHARFLNLPPGEIPTVERIFFQIQQAHWYYEDEWADIYSDYGTLPHLRFEEFSKSLFNLSPMLKDYCLLHADFKAKFKEYSASIPRYGTILVNENMTHMLLVSNLANKSYSFPKGKINQNESGIDCAAREAYEETGYNPRTLLSESMAIISSSSSSSSYNDNNTDLSSGFLKLYVAIGVPDDGSVIFSPLTKKEIGGITWVEISSMENYKGYAATENGYKPVKLYGVTEHLTKLQQIFSKYKKLKRGNNKHSNNNPSSSSSSSQRNNHKPNTTKSSTTTTNVTTILSNNNNKGSSQNYNHDHHNNNNTAVTKDTLLDIPLENKGKWKVNDMFQANAKILGVQFVYDGNPHTFGDESMNALPTTNTNIIPENSNTTITNNKATSTNKQRSKDTPKKKSPSVTSSSTIIRPAPSLHDTFTFDRDAIIKAMNI